MIDTDKYEAYKPTRWPIDDNLMRFAITSENIQLAKDAPLLLEEVKRLRKYAELVADIGDMIYENSNSYELTWDEFNEMLKEMIE